MKQPWTDSILRGLEIPRGKKSGSELTGGALEQAYRELLLQNQVLHETNQRLQAKVTEADEKGNISSMERQLIREQRKAITDRAHDMRQLQYVVKGLQRERDQLSASNRHLSDQLARHTAVSVSLKRHLAATQAEAAALKQQLAERQRELAMLTDRYYQLQAKHDPSMSTERVVNVDF